MGSGVIPSEKYSCSFATLLREKGRRAMGKRTEPEFLTFKEPRNLFQGIDSAILCSPAGRYDNLIPSPFLAPTDCLKIPAHLALSRYSLAGERVEGGDVTRVEGIDRVRCGWASTPILSKLGRKYHHL